MSFGIVVSAIITLFTPLIARQSTQLLIVSRALIGAAMVSTLG